MKIEPNSPHVLNINQYCGDTKFDAHYFIYMQYAGLYTKSRY